MIKQQESGPFTAVGKSFEKNYILQGYYIRGTQQQFSGNICSEDDLRSRIFGTFFPKFLACLPLLGFSNI